MYTSHYTENVNYDPANPQTSFRSLLPHIISAEDITAFNEFFAQQRHIEIMSNFKKVGNAISVVTDEEAKKRAFIEGCKDMKNTVLHFNEELRVEMDRIGIKEEDTVLSLLGEVAGLYETNYNAAGTDNEIIELIVAQANMEEPITNIVKSFVDLMSSCMTSIYFGPGTGAIIGATWTLATIMMDTYQFASLYGLATTIHGRVGSRVEIYAGIVDRP